MRNPILFLCVLSLFAVPAAAQPAPQDPQEPQRSPLQRSHHGGQHGQQGQSGPQGDGQQDRPGSGGGSAGEPATFPIEFRSMDGSGNNLRHDAWGAAVTVFRRILSTDYADGLSAPSGALRKSAREISNTVVAQSSSIPNAAGASDFMWQWGQFLDHDIDETPIADPAEAFDIEVPLGDLWFDPFQTGIETIPLDRSGYETVDGVRQQVNLITSYIDASNVYGSDIDRALELRTLDGTGRMRMSDGGLLPYNDNGFANAPTNDAIYFLAGDVRANEQVGLTAMHTLFVREHNYWAARLRHRGMQDGERIYQVARAIVTAEIQAITYREFLPKLLGEGAIRPYRGYRDDVDPSITNVFATAAYRFGHTMLSAELLRLDAAGAEHVNGHLSLAAAFFAPQEIAMTGIDPVLRGLAHQTSQEIDPYLIDEVRNLLFGPPGAGGLDLAALNIQRGRDHGLPGYHELRRRFGPNPARDFTSVSRDAVIQGKLAAAYASVESIDAWVGLVSEDAVPGAMVGPTLRRILADQFERLRDGDRFWYQAYLPANFLDVVENQTLATIIRRNTGIGAELQDDVFLAR